MLNVDSAHLEDINLLSYWAFGNDRLSQIILQLTRHTTKDNETIFKKCINLVRLLENETWIFNLIALKEVHNNY